MKPWREIAVPHRDVLEGTFQQSEFAADITAVSTGRAPAANTRTRSRFSSGPLSPRDALAAHAGRPAAQRQRRRTGHPVADGLRRWQDAHHAGRLHLATRKCPLSDLRGHPALIEKAGLMDVPQARVAVLDGTAHAPGQAWKRGRQRSRRCGASWRGNSAERRLRPGEGIRRHRHFAGQGRAARAARRYAPCVVLIDELVAYVRQFPEGQTLTGGSYDSNLSFVQALTEAAKLVPTAIVLASLPESDVEAGGQTRSGSPSSTRKDLRPRAGALETRRDGRGFRDRPQATFSSRSRHKGARRGLPRVRGCLYRRRGETARRDAGGPLLRPTCRRLIRFIPKSSTGSTRTGQPSTAFSAPAAC